MVFGLKHGFCTIRAGRICFYSTLAFSLGIPVMQYLYGRDWIILDVSSQLPGNIATLSVCYKAFLPYYHTPNYSFLMIFHIFNAAADLFMKKHFSSSADHLKTKKLLTVHLAYLSMAES